MPVKRTYKTIPIKERACLVGVLIRSNGHMAELIASINELSELAIAAGANPVCRVIQKLNQPSPTYLGSGKLAQMKNIIHDNGVTTAIFDDELTPKQQRLLESLLGIKVIDRTALILDVFASRAKTREGVLQIELAQTQYLLPRLAGQWSHLERLGGGIGTRGPGETQIETDRRLVRNRLSKLKKELALVQLQRKQQRRRRTRDAFTVSLVGYTNAGKSALFNAITSSSISSNRRLFETLDTTTRRVYLPSGLHCTLSDTVGFIRKLPPLLVASFRATLEEAHRADILIHVVDISEPEASKHAQIVDEILLDMQLDKKPKILVLNKLDLLSSEPYPIKPDNVPRHVYHSNEPVIHTSASNRWGLLELKTCIDTQLSTIFNISAPKLRHIE